MNPHGLKYDWSKHPRLEWGFNDLNGDGVAETLLTVWNGKTAVFVSDDGRLPWPESLEGQDWNEYFNRAFDVGRRPRVPWNETRSDWGNYTILVDRDGCGRFDGLGDWYYKALDLNGDGAPEAEYYHLVADEASYSFSNKLHVNLNGERDMSHLDWERFEYANEHEYLPGGRYIMNVHGSGFFLNSYSRHVQLAWENPIAWYDFDFDGRTNMVMRAADTHVGAGGSFSPGEICPDDCAYSGRLTEFEIAFELNGNTSDEKFHSLDMQLTYHRYRDTGGPDYRGYAERISPIRGLPEAAFLSGNMLSTRREPTRRYFPYMDGFKIASEFEGWEGVWLIFDEDDDDNRWEEMFSRYESAQADWEPYADRIGDRVEFDVDFGGKGQLYVGRFDGRIHLHHAEKALWDVDYLALYKGSVDRVNTDEGPEPPVGLRYPRVTYHDRSGNGFIDTLELSTVEYKREDTTGIVERVISLADFIDDDEPAPDVCPLIDVRVDVPRSGWTLESWHGRPLTGEDFAGMPNRVIYDRMIALYSRVADDMWAGARKLYDVARKFKLNVSEPLDRDLETPGRDELGGLTTIVVPAGYSRHLSGESRRDRYHNGYWLREKVFRDVLDHSGLDPFVLEKYYYTGRLDRLCAHLEEALH